MNKKLLMIGLTPIILLANDQAIETLNYSVSSNYSTSKYGDNKSLGANISIPISKYIGLGLDTSLSKYNSKNYNYKDNSKSIGLNLLLRDNEIGKIQLSYDYSKTSDNDNDKSTSNRININGTYYYNDFDFSLNRSRYKEKYDFGTFTGFNTYGSIAYYINNNLKISTGKSSHENYEVNMQVSYQPKIFKNSILLYSGYNKEYKSYNFGLSYSFDTKVDLKSRIRKY